MRCSQFEKFGAYRKKLRSQFVKNLFTICKSYCITGYYGIWSGSLLLAS